MVAAASARAFEDADSALPDEETDIGVAAYARRDGGSFPNPASDVRSIELGRGADRGRRAQFASRLSEGDVVA